MNTALKEEIAKYRKNTDYMAESAIAGTRVGFVRLLLDNLDTSAYAVSTPPSLNTLEQLIQATSDEKLSVELRGAINVALRTISDLQGQVRGMLIEQAEDKKRMEDRHEEVKQEA